MSHDTEINRACIIVLLIFAVSLCLHVTGYSETIIGNESADVIVVKGSYTVALSPATSDSLATKDSALLEKPNGINHNP